MMIQTLLRFLLAGLMVVAGAAHFFKTSSYLQMMPPWIPWHQAAVWVSGVLEIALGIGLVIPQTQRYAAWGLVALLIAVFPANVHVAINNIAIEGMMTNPWQMWLRLPFQVLLVGWAYWYTRA